MKIIGITGGVGAGKSSVLQILKEQYGAVILMTDAIGKEVMEPCGRCFERILALFGEGIKQEDGTLNRAAIAGIVFSDPEKLRMLNEIVHPAVWDVVMERLEEARAAGKELAVIESAILLEAGYENVCDEVWGILTDREVRIGRLMESRGYSREKCLSVMDAQMSDEELRRVVSRIINNSGTTQETADQIASFLSI